jgi:hypothetical protein
MGSSDLPNKDAARNVTILVWEVEMFCLKSRFEGSSAGAWLASSTITLSISIRKAPDSSLNKSNAANVEEGRSAEAVRRHQGNDNRRLRLTSKEGEGLEQTENADVLKTVFSIEGM